jgi:hypothetical protein
MLEDWLLQSFDDYIKTCNANEINALKNSTTSLSDSNECIILIDDNCQSTSTTVTAIKSPDAILDSDFNKKQEINYIILQILTNLLACGAIEYANGFENTINKTFKVCFRFWLLLFYRTKPMKSTDFVHLIFLAKE